MELLEPNLLIADDDRDFRESLGEVFQRRGFATKLAADGREAVDIVRAQAELHLVILDVHMPRLSGLEALGEIRRQTAPTLPCVLMSADLDEQIVQQATELKTASVLAKPFTLKVVTSTVEEVLRTSYGWTI